MSIDGKTLRGSFKRRAPVSHVPFAVRQAGDEIAVGATEVGRQGSRNYGDAGVAGAIDTQGSSGDGGRMAGLGTAQNYSPAEN